PAALSAAIHRHRAADRGDLHPELDQGADAARDRPTRSRRVIAPRADVATGFGIDPEQGLSQADELRLVRLAADLGYDSAWTNSGADAGAFDRCLRWHEGSGLPVGISAVPASGRPTAFYAEHARRLWDATHGRFTLVVGSGRLPRPAQTMRPYLTDLRQQLPAAMPLYVAALGPLMLRLAAQL